MITFMAFYTQWRHHPVSHVPSTWFTAGTAVSGEVAESVDIVLDEGAHSGQLRARTNVWNVDPTPNGPPREQPGRGRDPALVRSGNGTAPVGTAHRSVQPNDRVERAHSRTTGEEQ